MSSDLTFRPRVFPLETCPTPGTLLFALRERRGPCLLESGGGTPARFSLLGFDPLEAGALPRDLGGLRRYLGQLRRGAGDLPPGPFHGGFLGALGYEVGVAGESLPLPADPWGAPPIAGGLYTDFVVIDHRAARAWLVLGEDPGDGRPGLARRRDDVLDRLAAAADPGRPEIAALGPLIRHVSADEHRARIERVRAWIERGEIYQANLAHRFSRSVRGSAVDLYRHLRSFNGAPYMGYLDWGAGALLSASPELLLELDGTVARTRPIKGTVARGKSAAEDVERRAELLASEKDLAELAMIVDLERNDLGRIARSGSVRVEGFPTLQSFDALHHLVADVSAEPRRGLDAIDVLAALFPGGSITGAPKLRSMEVIAAIEGEGRGFFTGSLGFLDLRGRARLNILIRTLVWRPAAAGQAGPPRGEVSFHVGGGITWSSDPVAEERETRVKGVTLAAALAGDGEPALDAGLAEDARPEP